MRQYPPTMPTNDAIRPYLDGSIDLGTVFDVARGLYWFCADTHGGQDSTEYAILSGLNYTPGASERGPADDDLSGIVYHGLMRHQLDAAEVAEFVHTEYVRLSGD